jgi:hypothetical protein
MPALGTLRRRIQRNTSRSNSAVMRMIIKEIPDCVLGTEAGTSTTYTRGSIVESRQPEFGKTQANISYADA